MKELTSVEAREVFKALTTELNTIRWGSVALDLGVVQTLVKNRSKHEGETQVWIVGASVGERMRCEDLRQQTPESQALIDVFDPVSHAAYSIGVMYGSEVLVGEGVPKDIIILAEVTGTKVLGHVASWIRVSE